MAAVSFIFHVFETVETWPFSLKILLGFTMFSKQILSIKLLTKACWAPFLHCMSTTISASIWSYWIKKDSPSRVVSWNTATEVNSQKSSFLIKFVTIFEILIIQMERTAESYSLRNKSYYIRAICLISGTET